MLSEEVARAEAEVKATLESFKSEIEKAEEAAAKEGQKRAKKLKTDTSTLKKKASLVHKRRQAQEMQIESALKSLEAV